MTREQSAETQKFVAQASALLPTYIDAGYAPEDAATGALHELCALMSMQDYAIFIDALGGNEAACQAVVAKAAAQEEQAACAYCHQEVSDESIIPDADDDAGWLALAAEHSSACEWLETRAHRRDAQTHQAW